MAESSEELSRDIARLVDDKLGEDIVCLDMRELVTYTDYLVICTARNERQAEAIADDVHLRLKHDRSLLPVNPDRSGDVGWTVLDYLDCRASRLHRRSPRALRPRRSLARSTPHRARARPGRIQVRLGRLIPVRFFVPLGL